MTSSCIQGVIIYVVSLVAIKPEDMVDASIYKSVGGTWRGHQSLTAGNADIMDSHDGARVECDRRSAPTFSSPFTL